MFATFVLHHEINAGFSQGVFELHCEYIGMRSTMQEEQELVI
jgi:hypothetical protein